MATGTINHETPAMNRAIELLSLGILEMDDEGRFWRTAIMSHGNWRKVPRRRAENPAGKGYLRLTLQLPSGKLGAVMAQRVVWTWRNGPIPPEIQINHKDLNKRNNRPDNLELATGAENIQHSYANGRPAPWHKATQWRGKPRIGDEQRERVRVLRASGRVFREISEETGISITHIQRIVSEKGGK